MTLRIKSYSLIRDVQSTAVRPRVPANAFKASRLETNHPAADYEGLAPCSVV
jgi:hypothetical protein